MQDKNNSDALHHLQWQGKQILLVGTAHVSRQSTDQVREVIETEKPDTVCVELCASRLNALRNRERWLDTDIVKVIREHKSSLLLSNLLLATFQKRLADKLEVQPGQEMIQAVESAEATGAALHLVDREIRTTLLRSWRGMGLWHKVKLLGQMLFSFADLSEIDAQTVEQMKRQDVLESVLNQVGRSLPTLRRCLIDERDQYLAEKIRTAPGNKIVAVVGAGHVPGIRRNWDQAVDLAALDSVPPPGKWGRFFAWTLPAAVLGLFVWGFFSRGAEVGSDMVTWWIAANAVLAGAGALAALAHPLTVICSMVAAPLTSLNPMIAAGWVSGLVEAVSRRPKVIDFERLPLDITSFKGFWKNKVTRILLVVVFTNVGSSLGTFVAIPLMIRVL